MALKDLLKKRNRINDTAQPIDASVSEGESQLRGSSVPEFKFVRSTTTSEDVITVPGHPEDDILSASDSDGKVKKSKSRSPFRMLRNKSSTVVNPVAGSHNTSSTTVESEKEEQQAIKSDAEPKQSRNEGRLSRSLEKLHIRSHSRTPSGNSIHVPSDLPEIQSSDGADEAQWEKRATLLAQTSGANGRPPSSREMNFISTPLTSFTSNEKPETARQSFSDTVKTDTTIQEAIRLHEAGHLDKSTAMFGFLADPEGENNPLAQVLYGLALRHGWGIEPSPSQALTFLSQAASNAANVEASALAAGLSKGGTAKGELVLAIYELGNSYRHGWGVEKDAVAARHYYETAANLGDTDAMTEVAWCFMQGFGGKKDKFAAAKYLRMAEAKGVKAVGESWIWKEKYNPKT